jgi:hypothetical protein
MELCIACVDCPFGLSTSSSLTSPGPAFVAQNAYACSNSTTTRCPAGSGIYTGKAGSGVSGCVPCPFDQYNDGSSDKCQYCPSGTYPSYRTMDAPVLVCNPETSYCYRSDVKKVQGKVMKKGAASCSPQCLVGTGVLLDTKGQLYRSDQTKAGSVYAISACDVLQLVTRGSQGLMGSFLVNIQGDTSCSGQGCFPCGNWFVSKDNTCQTCGAGAGDRATLNSMGNTYVFATRCIPDICPWPYVAAGQYLMNEIMYSPPSGLSMSTVPEYSTLPWAVCGVNVHLGGTAVTITIIAVILLGIYAAAISFAARGHDEVLTATRRRKLVLGMLMTTASPAVDFVSDLMYIVSTLFYNSIMCIVCCFFYLLPMFFFWRMLVKHGVHFGFYIGHPPAFAVMDKYDSIPKALLGLAGYLPLYIINLPVSLPLFLAGHVLYCCKVFPISLVSNRWLQLYTRSDKHTSSVVIIIPLLQESIFEEMLTESVPQMIIQIVNNTMTNVWSPLSYFSTIMSGLMILNGIWRLVYYRLYLKIAINAIPTDLSEHVFKFTSIEEGESPLGKSVDAKVAPELELSTIMSAVCSPSDHFPTHTPFVFHT